MRLFLHRAVELRDGLRALYLAAPAGTPDADVRAGDARDLGSIPSGSARLVLTSPPYPGVYDYRERPRAPGAAPEIGSRAAFAADRGAADEYRRDLGAALREVRRVLAPDGGAVVVIGDSEAGGVLHRADAILRAAAAEASLRPTGGASWLRPRTAPRGARAAGAVRLREHLLVLEPSSRR